ncbi:hypothetical protein [Burkholderia diffusa]|uniref:hypothetical protein n=1 Tax=Burkholderia diffusa TaxID=488732 RepID=UPI000A7DEF92|nr:hypothetical protein [Burkholderia diffusa]
MINVQLNADGTAVIAYFSCPQDPSAYANLEVVPASDTRWKEYYDSLPEFLQTAIPAPVSASANA